jgi:NAD(P) transhydrogenase subunit alpha
MRIGVPQESLVGENRVALTPEVIQKLRTQGHEIMVQTGAGLAAGFPDEAFAQAGAQLASLEAVWRCPWVMKVAPPTEQEMMMGYLQPNTVLIGMLNPFDAAGLNRLAQAGVTAFALEAAPRTTRAQSLDVLSSQANIAGYKAILLAAQYYPRFFPMLMTAAGTVKAARVVVLGVGVAGLQAIATAKRLGAVVQASDVRPQVKEQVASLGAQFIDVPYETDEEREAAQGLGGYAKPMPASWLTRQQTEVAQRVAQADIVITTALIPGRAAPTLVTEAMLRSMRPGSVVVDMAAGKAADGIAGNCPLTQVGQVQQIQGVTLVGLNNLPALLPFDASVLYARNVLAFFKLIVDSVDSQGQFHLPVDEDIVQACLVTHQGRVIRL